MEAVIFNIQKFSIHDGPGIRTTVFFKGCNLRCRWCSNPEGVLPKIQIAYNREKCIACGECVNVCRFGARCKDGENIIYNTKNCIGCNLCVDTCINDALWTCGSKYTLDELMKEIVKDKAFYSHSGGGVTLSGGEVFLQADFVTALCCRLHEEKIHIAVETAAAVSTEVINKMLTKIDLWIIDFKHYDSIKHKVETGIGNEQIICNIKRIIDSGVQYIIRIPVIPSSNDSLEDARNFSKTLKKWGVGCVQLMPFHQFGEKKYAFLNMNYDFKKVNQIHRENLDDYAAIFEEIGIHVQIGG